MNIAKTFIHEGHQSIMIPDEFAFDLEEEIVIRKLGNMLMIFQRNKGSEIFKDAIMNFPEDALLIRESQEQQIREITLE
jgi:virulence-associated protein VagC